MKDYFCPASAENKVIEFVTNHTGTSRCNLTNKLWHKSDEDAVMSLIGFKSFDETLLHVNFFLTNVNANDLPKTSLLKTKIKIMPSMLTDLEEILIAKKFMQHFFA